MLGKRGIFFALLFLAVFGAASGLCDDAAGSEPEAGAAIGAAAAAAAEPVDPVD